MTITEFLEARIQEDEVREVHDMGTCSWANGGAAQEDGAPCDCGMPARVLAECEAKRRIVEDFWPESDGGFPDGQWDEHGRVLSLLALPYFDHPDYDEAWKPEQEVAGHLSVSFVTSTTDPSAPTVADLNAGRIDEYPTHL